MGRIPEKTVKPLAEFSFFLARLSQKGDEEDVDPVAVSEETFRDLLGKMETYGDYFYDGAWPDRHDYDSSVFLTDADVKFIGAGGSQPEERRDRAVTVCLKKNISLSEGFNPSGFLWSFWRLGETVGESPLERLKNDPVFFAEKTLGWTPFRYQARLLRDKSSRVVSCWGRQTGKTTTTAAKAAHSAFTGDGVTVLIVSPSLRQSMIMFERVQGFVSESPVLSSGVSRMTRTTVECLNGSRIIALPCSENLLRGYSADLVICDEAAFMPEDVIVRVVFPMLSATGGKAVFLSTPWGRDHFFYRAYMNPDYSVHKVKSSECPLITEGFLEEMRMNMTAEAFEMEYMAEFAESASCYFTQDMIRSCIDPALEFYRSLEEKVPAGEYYCGCDFGKLRDYSVISVILREGDLLRVVYLHELPLGAAYSEVIGHVVRGQGVFGFRKVWVDDTGLGKPVLEELEDSRVRVEGLTFTLKTKEELLTAVKIAMEQKRLRMPYHRRLCEQMNQQQYTYTKSGRLQFSHPIGSHDDMLWSLALAVYAATIGREPPKHPPRVLT